MGVIAGVAKLLCELKEEIGYHGNIVTLGKQNIILTPDQWYDAVKQTGISLIDVPMSVERHVRWKNELITAKYMFNSLGFKEVYSIDVSAYESADFIFDMNESELPNVLHNKFDCVFDGSTIEHIYHLPNVLANIHKMLKIGGKIIHVSPTNNFVDDGFYQLSPTFFLDYYSANEYKINLIKLHFLELTVQPYADGEILLSDDKFVDYSTEDFEDISFEPFGNEMCQTICIVTKTEASRYDVIPSQRRYASKDYWKRHFKVGKY